MKINGLTGELKTKMALAAPAVDAGKEFARRLEQAVKNKAQAGTEDAKLKQACRDMEAVFLNLMLSQMRATVPKTGLMGDDNKEEIMRSLLDSELTKKMSQAGGIGLADMLYRQLAPAPKLTSQAPR